MGDQGWGGSVDIQAESGGTFGDLSESDGITFWFKAATPASEFSSTRWNVKLFINSTGGTEQWHAALFNIIGDDSGEWKQAKIPFDAFAIPSWLDTYDGVLYKDQVVEIQMQIVTDEGVTSTGELYLDALGTFVEGGTQVGPLLQSFDVVGDISHWINSTAGSYALSTSSDFVEGEGAACLDYILIADQDWGGSIDMQFLPPGEDTIYTDISDQDGIRFNYKVTQPAFTTEGTNWNVKIFVESQGQEEEWHAGLSNILGDETGVWQEAKIPFTSFSIPSWLTTYDGILYLDKIKKIEMQVVCNVMGVETNGTICLDNLTAYSEGDVEIFPGYTLNDMNSPTTGVGSWINSETGSYSISATADAAEGDSAVCLSYNLVADLSWGGSVDMQFLPQGPDTTLFQDMSDHLGISFWYKVNTPPDTPSNIFFNVKLLVHSTGGDEEWHRSVGGLLADESGEWTQVYIPFTAFAIPNWQTTYDGILYGDQIYEIQFQLQGATGTTTSGDVCFDNLQSYDDEELATGTKVVQLPRDVKVYPNPASTEIWIGDLEDLRTIQVFNMNGALLKTINNQRFVDVADLYNGMYILRIQTGQGIYSAKFMKH